MQTSEFFTLDLKDLGKGLVVAAGGALITAIQGALVSGAFNWKEIGGVALAAGFSYLGKNLFTSAKIVTPVTDGNGDQDSGLKIVK